VNGPGVRTPSVRVRIAVAVGLAAATVAAFAGVLQADFLTFDDPVYVTRNDRVRAGLGLDGLAWAFRAGDGGNWHPLTWISHMLDVELFGLAPAGHHATSLALHVASSLLLLFALERMTRDFWRSALVAALFALHPLHVESVAWISERKDVLSTFFLALVLLAYARYAEEPTRRRFVGVLVLYAAGLMSKPMLVTLPFLLLLLDAWPLRRLPRIGTKRAVLEKLPLFALAATASAVAFLVQHATGAVATTGLVTLPIRASNALASIARYVAKTFWPSGLACFVPHPVVVTPREDLARLLYWPGALSAIGILVVTFVGYRQRRARPWLLVGWLWYLIALLPVIGLLQVGHQAYADRYTYLPTIGIAVAVAFALRELVTHRPELRAPVVAVTLAALAALSGLTWRQIGTWRDSHTLFEHALAVTDHNYMAHTVLGVEARRSGDLRGAQEHFEQALEGNKSSVRAMVELGQTLRDLGDLPGARRLFNRALRHDPANATAQAGLDEVRHALGEPVEPEDPEQ